MSATGVFIHPTAVVSERAVIGAGTKIWVNAQIREDSILGECCIISKDVYIGENVRIGNRCKIQNSVSVYTGVTLEDDVFLGPLVALTNDRVPRAFNLNWTVTPTLIRKGASIGANATIVCGTTIGRYAMVAAGSVVTKDVPAHGLVLGNPARLVGYVCICGRRLNEERLCHDCGEKIALESESL